MDYKFAIFLISAAFLFLFCAPPSDAAGSAGESIGVSLAIETYIKCTVSGDEMTVMTNSYQPVSILEDQQVLPEKAVFGQLATIKIKKDSIYTILSGI